MGFIAFLIFITVSPIVIFLAHRFLGGLSESDWVEVRRRMGIKD